MVSICMITYNHENFISESIDSILIQETTFPYQLIIGEDYSTDETRVICEEYALKHPNQILLLPSVKNLGVIPNWIRTMKSCKGKYIALCEGDDYWTDPYKLQKQVDFLEANPEYVLIGSRGDTLDQHTGIIYEDKHPYLDREISRDRLFHGHHFFANSVMFKNFNFKFPNYFFKYYCGDWMLYFLISEYGKLYLSSDKNMIYRNHPNGITKRINMVDKEIQEIRMLQEVNRYFHSKYLYHMHKACNYKAKRLYKNHFDDLTEEQLNIVKSCL